MVENVCINPDLGREDKDPEVVTRMIILGPKANVSESEIVNQMHLLGLPLTIKQTCYGAMVSGKEKDVITAIKEVRKMDPYNIFTKDRGFPPGDPRRCRGHRKGPREGFHQMEKEFKLLGFVSDALKNPKEVSLEEETCVPLEEFEEIMKECLEEEKLDKDNIKGKKHSENKK
ncbi:methanogenesis marker 6 protein [Methanobrevibacter arboriphilus]|uniref:methanogenesis marker 6 protein n=1 Tax=Methanobrevibacter arboriphilus TaxID=39441 RepID=UPI0005B2C6CA|nr:methanogenesis marker 6 protein [Methanobrevibacter arboriphilus]